MPGPLSGVRIADFTWAWAGPNATLLLGMMGAEIVKIESMRRPDHTRVRSLAAGPTAQDIDKSFIFNDLNYDKLSATLNLQQPKAVELAKRIIALSDVVVENFRPGVMERLGLGYEALRAVKPDIIMLSSSACGAYGPERRYVGYAPTFSAQGGLAYLTGYEDGPPNTLTGSIDLRSATFSAFAIVAALNCRALTGRGQFIDLSSQECMSMLAGDAFLEYGMTGRIPTRHGNRDEAMAPHNCYPCAGDDAWISIAVANDDEWRALAHVIGEPEWTHDPRFQDAYGRLRHQEELDRFVAGWTRQHTAFEAMELLQAVGVAAVPSFTAKDLHEDTHLKERQFTATVEHPTMGKKVVIGAPFKFSATPTSVEKPGPLIGQHNSYVFGELLGLSPQEIETLAAEEVIC